MRALFLASGMTAMTGAGAYALLGLCELTTSITGLVTALTSMFAGL